MLEFGWARYYRDWTRAASGPRSSVWRTRRRHRN